MPRAPRNIFCSWNTKFLGSPCREEGGPPERLVGRRQRQRRDGGGVGGGVRRGQDGHRGRRDAARLRSDLA